MAEIPTSTCKEVVPLPHHQQVGPCYTRPAYRDGKRKRAVKVFTIADESMYLLIFGVPSLSLEKVLRDRIKNISPPISVEKIRYPDVEIYTEAFLVKFLNVAAARRVKRSMDDQAFYGGLLRIVYAPEFETVPECRVKLHTFLRYNDVLLKKMDRLLPKKFDNDKPLASSQLNIFQVPQEKIPQTGETSMPVTIFPANPYTMKEVFIDPKPPILSSGEEHASGDALEASRRHWSALGFSFASLPTPTVPFASQWSTKSFYTQSKSRKPGPPPLPPRPVPEAVLQALACRIPTDTSPTALKRARTEEIRTVGPCQHLSSSSSSSQTSHQVESGALAFVPISVHRRRQIDSLRVGELKKLAFTLGPKQGPSLPPSATAEVAGALSNQTVISPSPTDRTHKRMGYHRAKHLD